MSDLAEFMRARIDEDEAAALGVVNADGETYTAEWTEPLTGMIEIGDEWPLVVGDRRLSHHIARWDPARVLAEVEAKRRIIDLAIEATDIERGVDFELGHGSDGRDQDDPYLGTTILAALARLYMEHPDFDAGWLPEVAW